MSGKNCLPTAAGHHAATEGCRETQRAGQCCQATLAAVDEPRPDSLGWFMHLRRHSCGAVPIRHAPAVWSGAQPTCPASQSTSAGTPHCSAPLWPELRPTLCVVRLGPGALQGPCCPLLLPCHCSQPDCWVQHLWHACDSADAGPRAKASAPSGSYQAGLSLCKDMHSVLQLHHNACSLCTGDL